MGPDSNRVLSIRSTLGVEWMIIFFSSSWKDTWFPNISLMSGAVEILIFWWVSLTRAPRMGRPHRAA